MRHHPRPCAAAPSDRTGERGQALPLLLIALLLAGLGAAGLARVAVAASQRSMAQAAADAAALAGASAGEDAARGAAAANEADLVSFREEGLDVVVEVRRRGAVARARARWGTGPSPVAGPGDNRSPAIP